MTGLDHKAQASGIAGRDPHGARRHRGRGRGPRPGRPQRARGPAGADPRRARQQRRRRVRGRAPAGRAGGCRRSSCSWRPRSGPGRATPPRTGSASRAWSPVTRMHAPVARDVAILGQGIDKAGVVVDALLGTGVSGRLREPVTRRRRGHRSRPRRRRARSSPSTRPTAVDLTSGDPSRPGRPRRPHRDLPPPEDRAAHEDRPSARRPGARRADRDPAGGRPCLTSASPGSGTCCWSRPSPSPSCCWPPGVTALLPREGQGVVFHTPLLIVVLVVGTAYRPVADPPRAADLTDHAAMTDAPSVVVASGSRVAPRPAPPATSRGSPTSAGTC